VGVIVRGTVIVALGVGPGRPGVLVAVGQVNAVQSALQQLPSAAAPLSQTSPGWRMPSPQTGHAG
jgi:hypothetical protein